VRALLGVLAGDQRATKAILSTTSDFAPMIATDPFIAPFIPYRLELVNRNELLQRLTRLSTKQ
jgi:restriction system protein